MLSEMNADILATLRRSLLVFNITYATEIFSPRYWDWTQDADSAFSYVVHASHVIPIS